MKPLIALLLAVAATPLLAASDKAAKDPAEPSKPQMVCFTDAPTGSHLRKRTCVTQEEAEARRKRDQEAMERLHSSPQPLPAGQ